MTLFNNYFICFKKLKKKMKLYLEENGLIEDENEVTEILKMRHRLQLISK
jgi:hypothetical protein